MKAVCVVAALLLGLSASNGQFKSQVKQDASVSSGLIGQPSQSLFFGWFDPERFHMRHSFGMSYTTGGGYSYSLATYTNSMLYEITDNLNARADVSMSYSPFASLPQFNKNDLSSIYLSRAEVNYRPWESFLLQLQYRQLPLGSYSYSPFYNPWYRENGF